MKNYDNFTYGLDCFILPVDNQELVHTAQGILYVDTWGNASALTEFVMLPVMTHCFLSSSSAQDLVHVQQSRECWVKKGRLYNHHSLSLMKISRTKWLFEAKKSKSIGIASLIEVSSTSTLNIYQYWLLETSFNTVPHFKFGTRSFAYNQLLCYSCLKH